jgi:DNA invertase Pin-like site-specific DNA recombinase
MIPTVAYVRVSREEQARGDRTSLAQQQQAIADLAMRLHCEPPSQSFVDPGVSGGTAEDRPGFMALVAYCEANMRPRKSPGYVLVLNDSRWGRFEESEDSIYWQARLRHAGWHVRFAEADDTDNRKVRNILRTIYSVEASAYREQIKANARRGTRGTAALGYWQNEAPIGYRRLASEPGRDGRTLEIGQRKGHSERVRLTPGPDHEVSLIRWMFETYAEGGVSLGDLVRALGDRWPDRPWSRQTVGMILKNPAYVGDVVWCRRPHDKLERQETRVRPREEWVTTADAHPPLVSRQLYQRVQDRLRANKVTLRHSRVDYLLSGLIHCAQCGEPYIGAGGPIGPEGDEDRYRFYRDRGFDRGVCLKPLGTMQRRQVEPLVIDTVTSVVGHPSWLDKISREFERLLDRAMAHQSDGRTDVTVERARLLAERERLVTAIGSGTVTEAEAHKRLSALRDQLERLAQDDQWGRFADRRVVAVTREQLMASAREFPEAMDRLRGSKRRELLAGWIHAATMDKLSRILTLQIRPSVGLFSVLDGTPARASHQQGSRLVVTRQLQLPQHIVRKRGAR